MKRTVGKTYIRRERKWNFIITAAVLVAVAVTVAIVELLPWNAHELGYSDLNGVGRTFLYPFTFTDAQNNLYLLNEKNKVLSIDSSVSEPIHDSENNKIYYIKNNTLYEYNIKTNDRVDISYNVVKFKLIGNRRAIVCSDINDNIFMYMFKGEKTVVLSEASDDLASSYIVSDTGVLFAKGNKLMYCDYLGEINTVSDNISAAKKYYISKDGNKVCFYENDNMVIAYTNGKKILSMNNCQPIVNQRESTLIPPVTNELIGSDGIPFKYFIQRSDANMEPSAVNKGTLLYYRNGKLKELSENVYSVIHYSEEDDFILYTVLEGEKTYVYMGSNGIKTKKQIGCSISDKFLFDNRSGYLYFRNLEGTLYRYDVYDSKLKIVKIAENTDNFYDYYNKPFVAYTDIENTTLYLIEKNKIDALSAHNEKRLYGRINEVYLLCTKNEDGKMTLDYVLDDRMTRISNNAGANVFFDRDMQHIVYNESDKLYIWRSGETLCIGDYKDIKTVDIIK